MQRAGSKRYLTRHRNQHGYEYVTLHDGTGKSYNRGILKLLADAFNWNEVNQ